MCSWAPVDSQKQTNVLLVADPQLIDNHTYPGRNELLLQLSKHTVDVYIKQNYKALVTQLQPDYIIFLGDYLDNGRSSSDKYYAKEFRRFERIFNRWPRYKRGERWLTNVAGNHDIGFGDGVKLPSRERFIASFGMPNEKHIIDGVEFLSVDTISYSAASEQINDDSRQFVKQLSSEKSPRVLLSHVPFFRDTEKLTCGPLREHANFLQVSGYQYQSALTPAVSTELLDMIQPDLIFSGDDHDYCDVQHPNSAREITVKSISMAMGVSRPAVQLLSFSAQDETLNYNTEICYLPRPYINVLVYVVLAVFSGLFLLFYSVKSRRYVYTVLPSEHVTAVLLESGQAPMSKRMSKFLEEDDSSPASLAPLSNYTKTSTTFFERFQKRFRLLKAEVFLILKRWNLITFFRSCSILGSVTIALYVITISFI
ncbi:hypothetical protein JCM33374_g2143 [Metschnikowia sp. JCM 33374]|nr:hypothetical protein JCM33374_g2143 [Metschnikowia sp. JCM 33374]